MSLDYQVFDPLPCHFPRPRVPVLPRGFEAPGTDDDKLLRKVPPLGGRGLHFSRGRYALGEAYRRAGLDADSALLTKLDRSGLSAGAMSSMGAALPVPAAGKAEVRMVSTRLGSAELTVWMILPA